MNHSLHAQLTKAVLYSIPLAFVYNVVLFVFFRLLMGRLPASRDILEALDLSKSENLTVTLIHFGFAFLQSFLLLVPIVPDISLSKQPHALWPRVVGAAFLCSLAIVIPLFALIDILEYTPYGVWSTVKIYLKGVCGVWVFSWLFWSFFIWKASRERPEIVEERAFTASRLSLVGLALCLPWYWILRRKESCECSLGTFYALIVGIMSLLIVGGPLLFVLGRDRKIRKIFDSKFKKT